MDHNQARKLRIVVMFTLERQLNTSMSCAPGVAPSVSNWSQLVPIGHGQPTPLGQTKSRGVKGARWFILVTQRVLMVVRRQGRMMVRLGRVLASATKGDGRLKGEEAVGQFGLKRALRVIITWAVHG